MQAYTYNMTNPANTDSEYVLCEGTLEECRAAAREFLGTLSRRWDGDAEAGDVEAYHESDDELCGGVGIRVS